MARRKRRIPRMPIIVASWLWSSAAKEEAIPAIGWRFKKIRKVQGAWKARLYIAKESGATIGRFVFNRARDLIVLDRIWDFFRD